MYVGLLFFYILFYLVFVNVFHCLDFSLSLLSLTSPFLSPLVDSLFFYITVLCMSVYACVSLSYLSLHSHPLPSFLFLQTPMFLYPHTLLFLFMYPVYPYVSFACITLTLSVCLSIHSFLFSFSQSIVEWVCFLYHCLGVSLYGCYCLSFLSVVCLLPSHFSHLLTCGMYCFLGPPPLGPLFPSLLSGKSRVGGFPFIFVFRGSESRCMLSSLSICICLFLPLLIHWNSVA